MADSKNPFKERISDDFTLIKFGRDPLFENLEEEYEKLIDAFLRKQREKSGLIFTNEITYREISTWPYAPPVEKILFVSGSFDKQELLDRQANISTYSEDLNQLLIRVLLYYNYIYEENADLNTLVFSLKFWPPEVPRQRTTIYVNSPKSLVFVLYREIKDGALFWRHTLYAPLIFPLIEKDRAFEKKKLLNTQVIKVENQQSSQRKVRL